MRESRAGRPPVLPVRVDQLLGYGAPDDPALTFRSLTLSYAQLREQVARVASGLHALGVRRGDRVAVYAEKRTETVVALLAASAAGAVFVPVNPLARPRQLSHVLADCAARAVITTTQRRATVGAALDPAAPAGHLVLIGGPGSDSAGSAGSAGTGSADDAGAPGGWAVHDWADLAAAGPGPVPGAEDVIDQDVAAILYTSGSTGGPKGVVLSHRNLLAGAASVAGYLGHGPDDVILAVLPLSFDAGLSQVTTTLLAGGHVVLMNYLVPADVLRLCARHQVTGLTCVPPLWQQLAGPQWPGRPRGCGTSPAPAAGCPGSRWTGFASSLAERRRSSCTGLPRHSGPATWTRPRSTGAPGRSARPSPTPRSWWCDRTGRRARRASTASWCTGGRWCRWGTGTTRPARPSGSARCPGRAAPGRRSRCGRATRCTATRTGSCTSSAAPTR